MLIVRLVVTHQMRTAALCKLRLSFRRYLVKMKKIVDFGSLQKLSKLNVTFLQLLEANREIAGDITPAPVSP